MDIISFSSNLEDRMRSSLSGLSAIPNEVAKASTAIQIVATALHELKRFCVSYAFISIEEEVKFFKEIKPVFLCQHLYQRRIFRATLFDAFNGEQQRLRYGMHELRRLHTFASRHAAFYGYCLSDQTDRDISYFTRSAHVKNGIAIDAKFHTPGDGKLAAVLCNEMLRDHFRETIQRLQADVNESKSSLIWTAPKTALIELIYALHETGAINNAAIETRQLVAEFERLFKVKMGNFYRSFHEIANRKNNRTIFLDQMREALIRKMNALDE